MRFKFLSVLAVLLLVGSNDARPSKNASPEVAVEEASTTISKDDDSSRRPMEQRRSSSAVESDTRLEPPRPQRDLKDLQYMDQSMRTVATQLLNVSNTEESTVGLNDRKIANGELAPNVMLIRKKVTNANPSPSVNQQNFNLNAKSDMELVKDINSEISSMESMGMGFGRPINSKFGYFESSHPGQAMAMTEEELERELMTSTTRLMTAHKNHATTTGGISTWILLNPPTTTTKPAKQDHVNAIDEKEGNVRSQTKSTTSAKISETTQKIEVQTSTPKTLPKSTTPMEKITTLTKAPMTIVKKTTLTVRQPSTAKPEKSTETSSDTGKIKTAQTTLISPTTRKDTATTPKSVSGTKKIVTASRPTQKIKATTPRSANVTSRPTTTKLSRPSQSAKPKPPPTRRVTTKPVGETTKITNTPKIEKVTFRPIQMITTPKSLVESVERPIFATKLKTSFVAGQGSKISLTQSTETTTPRSGEGTKIKEEIPDNDVVQVTVNAKPQISLVTKPNNVLKVQLKKPVEAPKVKIQSVQVNEPVLRIEKIEETNAVLQMDSTKATDLPTILDNSKIDLKFDFNPELTKIDVTTSTIATTKPPATKRPHKRKKNRTRRRKPTTSAPTSVATSETTSAETSSEDVVSSTSTSPFSTSTQSQENLSESGVIDNSIQESKVAPESKVSPSKTKTKKKTQQIQKPVGTQLYNFLSREIMPSFGMISLVGLGLGLASYFLYPFGGVAARRNYVVEPNYKYNLDEYGGNYGQNEEEVFSKVLQGMTNSDGKYGGIKDYENNYYRYQQFGGAYTDSTTTTRRGDQRRPTSSATNYRPPAQTTVYDNKYRNTEFKYPDLTTTPNYYERHKETSFLGKKPVNGNSRFVVGNVPKEYTYDDKNNNPTPVTSQVNFERDIAKNNNFGKNPVNVSPSYGQAEPLKTNEEYEEIVITPAAVAVEHGPRSLKADFTGSRRKRESVIQVIPSRTEIKKEEEEIEKEEPLSNEILDIIDSVIPVGAGGDGKEADKMHSERDGDKTMNETEKVTAGNGTSKNIDDGDKNNNETAETTTQFSANATANAAVEITSTSTSTTAAPRSSTPTVKSLSVDEILATTVKIPTIDEILATTAGSISKDPDDSSLEWFDLTTTTKPEEEQHFGVFNFVKKLAEVKFKLGLAILKHASEGFARYLGHVQKRVNGEE